MAKAYNSASCRAAALVWMVCGVAGAFAQPDSPDGAFTLVKDIPADVTAARANVRPVQYQAVRVNWDALTQALAQAPLEDTPAAANPVIIALPMPDGWFARFRVVESPIMEPALAAAFPDIKTYLGQGIDDPAASVRFDRTMHGFHAQILSPTGRVYIDPYSFGDTSYVTSYAVAGLTPRAGWACRTEDDGAGVPGPGTYAPRALVSRKTFRTAVAGTGEYTAFHGGTVAAGQAAIVTAMNRVSGVYEIDLAARLTLVANNQNLVFTNAATDPYANNGSSGDLTANHNTCNSVIGSANYDVGHLFCTGNGGVASISSVCSSANKGKGLSGLPQPINDPFSVDYVAHEMGHQFAGRHCFNNCSGGPGDAQNIAYEVGSGSTIMAYAGICGSNDLQPNSDAMFHSGSLETMKAFINGSCGATLATTNNTPTVNAGPDRTIPKGTPLALEAVGADIDGDALSYSWEERDTGPAVSLPITDNGSSPIMRPWAPALSPTRTVPRLQNLLNNTFAVGEILPTTGRLLRFRCVARDNAPGNGGFGTDDVTYTVSNAAGPFLVTSPNTNVSWSGTQTVTWNVANTAAAPVNCANVQILLSTNGGNSFDTVLAASTPNDGSEVITLPGLATSQARIAVKAVDNVFFDISNANFTINNAINIVGTGSVTLNDSDPGGNGNGIVEPGEAGLTLLVQLTNTGGVNATGISATLSSLTPTAQVMSASSAYPNLNTGAVSNNATPFVIDIDPAHVCGVPVNLRLNVSTAQGPAVVNFTLQTGSTPPPSTTTTVVYTGGLLAIPDNDAGGVTATVTVAGLPAIIRDVNLRFNGTTCSVAANAPTVGLSHGNIGDIAATLTAPGGASCVVIDRSGFPGAPAGNSGNNLCNSIFDDEAAAAFETAAATLQPFTGSWSPAAPLAVFDGANPNGVWTLNVRDLRAGDTGTLRFFSLVITAQAQAECDPPFSPCDPDYNCDGNADQDDVACLINVVAGNPGCECRPPDFNFDGNVDQDDVAALINVVAGGPCP